MSIARPFQLAALAGFLALGACATDPLVRAERAIDRAVLSEDRPMEERADDATRLPADVLKFAGLAPGMTVVEMEAGGGYYTEIISRAVGDEGRVYMQNPRYFDTFLGDALEVRLAENRLPNVQVVRSQFDDLSAIPSGSADMVTWVLGPHELFYTTAPDGTALDFGDVEGTFLEINRVLKPGGTFLAVDHAAPPGAPVSVGNSLHRIDPGVVQIEAEKAGLAFSGTSPILENTADDMSKNVFDPSVRRQTNRFILTFRKQN